jgi:hypothetical protein
MLKSIGMKDKSVAIDFWIKLNNAILNAEDVWFQDELDAWPPELFDAVKDLDMIDINQALYRTAGEETDVAGAF